MINRRQMLKGMCASAAAASAHQLWAPAAAFAQQADHTLVTIFLRGGMDGLSAVVPYADERYRAARPTIGIEGADALPLGRGFGLHPALRPLHDLRHMLAVVHGAGLVSGDRSHFVNMKAIESGTDGGQQLSSGWLARHLVAQNATAAPLHAVSWANTPAASLRGDATAVGVGRIDQFGLGTDQRLTDEVSRTLGALYGADDEIGRSGKAALAALEQVTRIRNDTPTTSTDYPTSHLGRSLSEVARTIKSDSGLVAATVDVAGWDTHEAMGATNDGRMARLLGDLGSSLQAFVGDLGHRMRNVTVITMSEFGRRVQENASGGVDHGRGTAMFVLGEGITPGVHGDWAGLDEDVLDRGDVPVVNDHRDVLADVLTGRMGGADLATVFPGLAHRRLGIA